MTVIQKQAASDVTYQARCTNCVLNITARNADAIRDLVVEHVESYHHFVQMYAYNIKYVV